MSNTSAYNPGQLYQLTMLTMSTKLFVFQAISAKRFGVFPNCHMIPLLTVAAEGLLHLPRSATAQLPINTLHPHTPAPDSTTRTHQGSYVPTQKAAPLQLQAPAGGRRHSKYSLLSGCRQRSAARAALMTDGPAAAQHQCVSAASECIFMSISLMQVDMHAD